MLEKRFHVRDNMVTVRYSPDCVLAYVGATCWKTKKEKSFQTRRDEEQKAEFIEFFWKTLCRREARVEVDGLAFWRLLSFAYGEDSNWAGIAQGHSRLFARLAIFRTGNCAP